MTFNQQLEQWENNQFKRLDDELEGEARWEYERTKTEEKEQDAEDEERKAVWCKKYRREARNPDYPFCVEVYGNKKCWDCPHWEKL